MAATARSIDSGPGYAEYLEGRAQTPERGDYYLGTDGAPAEAPGVWQMRAETLAQLGLDPAAAFDSPAFRRLIAGQHPTEERDIRRPGRVRDAKTGQFVTAHAGGIDVQLAAPKSVSIAFALGTAQTRAAIDAAQTRAVAETVGYMRDHLPTYRQTGPENTQQEAVGSDLLAASYRHTVARGVEGEQNAPDPHLHDHVLITGVMRPDGRAAAVASRSLTRFDRQLEVDAHYLASLSHHLREQGIAVNVGTGNKGRYFELAEVPQAAIDALSARTREVKAAVERFRVQFGREPAREELQIVKLGSRQAKLPTNRDELARVWEQRSGLTAGELDLTDPKGRPGAITRPDERPYPERVQERLTTQSATASRALTRSVALCEGMGQAHAAELVAGIEDLQRDGTLLELADGKFTTGTVRTQEQSIATLAEALARPQAEVDVGDAARTQAAASVAEQLGAPLSAEQLDALRTVTGPERMATLIGQAGTGKGVVLEAAARAEQHAGRYVVGVAVAGATAQRLGESPDSALGAAGQTMSIDALLARERHDPEQLLSPRATVIVDEAAMADTKRKSALITLVCDRGGKIVTVGDSRQLSSIGPGGMFDIVQASVPSAELTEIRRTTDPAEQAAWEALRAGEPERALAHYQAQGRLHLDNTRTESIEAATRSFAEITEQLPVREVALVIDGNNTEIARANARIQQLRAGRGELGELAVAHPDPTLPYQLREGDRVSFVASHPVAHEARVENGVSGEILAADPEVDAVMIGVDGSGREVPVVGDELRRLRLGYAHHVMRFQGATVTRAIGVTGGWQTSRESTYVLGSRARERTDWYANRDELGAEGTDVQRVERLAAMQRRSGAQLPSIREPLASPELESFPALNLAPPPPQIEPDLVA